MNLQHLFFIPLIIFLTSCSSQQVDDYPRYDEQVVRIMNEKKAEVKTVSVDSIPDMSKIPEYITAGNAFDLSHPSDNKLSGTFRSDFNGRLELPYGIVVDITKKTFDEVKAEVMNAYRKFFRQGVEGVNFTLSKRGIYVEVRGLVKKPGRYLVRATDPLDLVIDQAGGVQGDISNEYFIAQLKQQNYDYQVFLNKYYQSGSSQKKIRWLGGDNIFVSKVDSMPGMNSKEIPFVNIIGGVTKPGKVLFQKDASLFNYIEKTGGTLQGLGYDECYVFRNTKEGLKKIQFAFNRPETIPAIFPNDTIYMNSQIKTPGDILLERLSHVAGLISTVALLIIAL